MGIFARMIRHIVLTVFGWVIVLVGIDAEDTEIAGLTWPHPVVGLATELTHRLRHCEDQSQVGEVLIGSGIVAVALIEGVDIHVERGVDALH